MPPIVVERRVPRPLPAVWAVVADVASHRLPLTRVETDPGQPRVGWGFRGISGLGPLRLVDAMVLTRWSPPRPGADAAEYAVAKVGRLLAGWADVRLEARRTGGHLAALAGGDPPAAGRARPAPAPADRRRRGVDVRARG